MMLNNASGFDKIYLATGYTDLRRGIDGLTAIIQQEFQLDPFQNVLFLFCGKRTDRIKALLWEGDGFVLLYKRLEEQIEWAFSSGYLMQNERNNLIQDIKEYI